MDDKRIKILIAEDEEKICKFWEELLSEKYNAQAVSDGQKAIQAVEENEFDVIITDLKMPGANGMDILKKAQQKDEFTEVIIITGYATLDSATDAINAGASSYLLKPVSMDKFIAQVEKAVTKRKFHLKSVELEKSVTSHDFGEDQGQHIADLRGLFNFSNELSRSMDYKEISRRFLVEAQKTKKINASFVLIVHDTIRAAFFYGLPDDPRGTLLEKLLNLGVEDWNRLNEDNLIRRADVTIEEFETEKKFFIPANPNLINIPFLSMGKNLGSFFSITSPDEEVSSLMLGQLHMLANLVTPVLSNAFTHHQLKTMASTDGLTGVNNHRAFHDHLDREITRAVRNSASLALVLMDIDNFKMINDSMGHQTGDLILIALARIVSQNIRKTDIFARYGGEEFVLILPGTALEGIKVKCDRIIERVHSHSFATYQEKTINISISMGVFFVAPPFQQKGLKKNDLIEKADKALYQAKGEGKDRWAIFSEKKKEG